MQSSIFVSNLKEVSFCGTYRANIKELAFRNRFWSSLLFIDNANILNGNYYSNTAAQEYSRENLNWI